MLRPTIMLKNLFNLCSYLHLRWHYWICWRLGCNIVLISLPSIVISVKRSIKVNEMEIASDMFQMVLFFMNMKTKIQKKWVRSHKVVTRDTTRVPVPRHEFLHKWIKVWGLVYIEEEKTFITVQFQNCFLICPLASFLLWYDKMLNTSADRVLSLKMRKQIGDALKRDKNVIFPSSQVLPHSHFIAGTNQDVWKGVCCLIQMSRGASSGQRAPPALWLSISKRKWVTIFAI